MEPIREYTQTEENLTSCIGQKVRLHGSIYKIRKMSGFAFVLLRMKDRVMQCVYNAESADFALEELKEESCVEVFAEVVKEERAHDGFELHLLSVRVLSVPVEPAPIVINQKKVDTALEKKLDYRPISLRNEKERAIFKIQAAQTFLNWTILERRRIWHRVLSFTTDDGGRV